MNIISDDDNIIQLLYDKNFDTNILPIIIHAISEKDEELAEYILSNPSEFFMRLMTKRMEEMNNTDNTSNFNTNLIQPFQLSETGEVLRSMFPNIEDYIIIEALQVCEDNIELAASYLSDYFL